MSIRPILWVVIGVALGFLTIAAGIMIFQYPYQYQGTVFEPPVPAEDFSLEQFGGETFQMSDQVGKVVLLFFGYTHCPDVCPVTLNDFRKVQESLEENAEQIKMVMITVDPDRDTPEIVNDYAARFSPGIVGLSGPEDELLEIWKDYFVYRALESPESSSDDSDEGTSEEAQGYLVDHTARVYVVDKAGNLRLSFPFGFGAEAMAADVRQLLRE